MMNAGDQLAQKNSYNILKLAKITRIILETLLEITVHNSVQLS